MFKSEVVLLLYGESYASTGEVLNLQCWYMVLFSVFGFIGNTLGAADKQKWIASLSIFYAFVNAPLLWYCSKFGATGLSYGYLIGSVLNMTYHIYYLQKAMPIKIPTQTFIIAFSIMICGFFLSVSISDSLSLYIRILFVIIVFLLIFLCKNKIVALMKSHD